MSLKNLMIVCCVLLFSIDNIAAQSTTGSLSGTVTDSLGAVLPEVTVTAKLQTEKNEAVSKTVKSGDAGAYKFEDLPPGIYEVTADSPAFEMSYKNKAVRVSPDRPTSLNIEMSYGRSCEDNTDKTFELNEADRIEIVNQILEDALLKQKIVDFEMTAKQKNKIVLSAENIKLEWIKPLKNVELKLLTKDEIQKKADEKGDFLYLSFSPFRIKGECLLVTLSNSWAVGKNSGMFYLSGGGNVYLYRREGGKLVGKSVGGWVS